MPSEAEPPLMPFTDQVTAVLALPVTVAVKDCDAANWIDAAVGETVTVTGGGAGASVTVACPDEAGLALEVA